jgi:ribosome-binding protein aMBF1 (putative translation factor)
MECRICGRGGEEVELFEGIFEEKIEPVCIRCSHIENIPVIRRPAENSEEKRENLSVRERMERIADPSKKFVQKEQFMAHKNLVKLNFPSKREDHPDLVENYDWILKTARRRKKLSQVQLAEELIVPLQVIASLESGSVPKDFTKYLEKLELFLGVSVRKKIPSAVNLNRKPQNRIEEEMILDSVKKNMESKKKGGIWRTRQEEEIDFSDKERVKNLTLRDLIGIKRRGENREE